MSFGVPWYEGKYYLVALKDHVHMGFAYNQILDAYVSFLEGKGKYMRHVKFFKVSDVDEKKLLPIIKARTKGYRDPHGKQ